MTRIIISPAADSDWDEILEYLTTNAGELAADKYNTRLEKLYDRLADFPGSGASRPKLGRQMRIGIVSPYIVIHRHDKKKNVLTVLRILHGSRNITRKLFKS